MRSALSLVGLSLLATAGCSAPENARGIGWELVGGLDGDLIPLVAIEKAHMRDGAVYRDAIDKICGPGNCVQVGFFEAGASVPQSSSRAEFFQSGGWRDYSPLAIYMGSEFTEWDCERAGEEAAPLSALCGEGAKEQYEAVLSLATRDGWVKGCGLSEFGGRQVVVRFAQTLPLARREQIMAAYEQMATSSESGPDDPADCQALRRTIEARAQDARKLLQGS